MTQLWIFLGLAALLSIALSVAASKVILNSPFHSTQKKYLFLALIWGIPIFGTIAAMLLINRDFKNTEKKLDSEVVDAINSFTEKIDKLEASVQKKNKTLH